MIQEFKHGQLDPLAAIHENEHNVFRYVQMLALRQVAEAVWKITSKEERQKMLQHLYTHVRDDNNRPFDRFNVLHELIEKGFGEKEFLELADEDDFDGELPMVLHPYLSLYVDISGGVNRARFSSDAFYLNYKRAHLLEA